MVAGYLPVGVSPAEAYDELQSLDQVDIRQLLGSVRSPVLVLHRTGDRYADVHAARYLAERLPTARPVELAGDDSFLPQSDSQSSTPATFPTSRRARLDSAAIRRVPHVGGQADPHHCQSI